MKKTIFILSALIFGLSFSAVSQKTRVAISAGIDAFNLSRTIQGADKDGEYRIGIIAGMQLEVPLCKKGNFSFQPDFHYVQKGAASIPGTPVNNKIYTALRYAELAPNFVYNFNRSKGTFYLGAGPYLSFNLPSKNVSHTAGSPNVETDISFGDAVANDLKGIDYGGNFVMGYRMANGIFVSANYIQGARNLVPEDVLALTGNADNKIKNIGFSLRVGFLFKTIMKEKEKERVRKKK
jgi:hypothetical protein